MHSVIVSESKRKEKARRGRGREEQDAEALYRVDLTGTLKKAKSILSCEGLSCLDVRKVIK